MTADAIVEVLDRIEQKLVIAQDALVTAAEERRQLEATLESERQARKLKERVIERFGNWLDGWSTSGASCQPSEVYAAWDRAREGK